MIYEFEERTPEIAASCYIADNATVIGDVVLREESSIWFGAVLRGDIEPVVVGHRSNIQDNSVAHTSNGFPVVLGEDVTVGHKVTLHGCRIGNNCLIGMGAILLDGCEIGDNCIVGAGALVKQGYKVPAGSLVVGSPARVIRKLGEDDFKNIHHYSERYVDLQARYRSGALKQLS
jgi:carbonic anhydrase/acetyltransferase-like protein (isoleucine patch superfamily)